MQRFTPMLVFWACAGCVSAGARSTEERPLFAAGWSGPPPRVAVQLAGPDASADKQARCAQTLVQAGALVDGAAPTQAVVTLQPGANRLQVMTAQRGLVRDEPRPPWTIERLCTDALYVMVDAMRRDAQPLASPSNLPPSRPTLTQPYSTLPLTQDRDRDLPAEQAPTPPDASGGIYRGPIQP
jgi:hypothetical protein